MAGFGLAQYGIQANAQAFLGVAVVLTSLVLPFTLVGLALALVFALALASMCWVLSAWAWVDVEVEVEVEVEEVLAFTAPTAAGLVLAAGVVLPM